MNKEVTKTDMEKSNIREMLNLPELTLPPEFDEKNIDRYNGGVTCVDFGCGFNFPLPFPEEGKKWAIRLFDTKSGALIHDLMQVDKDAPNSGWAEGYPKYDFKKK